MATELNGDIELGWAVIDEEQSVDTTWCDSTSLTQARNLKVTNPVLLEAYGLDDCHTLLIDRLIGCGDGDLFIPYKCGPNYIGITCEQPTALLYLPGRYKIYVKCQCADLDGVDIHLSQTALKPEIAKMYLDHQCCCCNGVVDNGEC